MSRLSVVAGSQQETRRRRQQREVVDCGAEGESKSMTRIVRACLAVTGHSWWWCHSHPDRQTHRAQRHTQRRGLGAREERAQVRARQSPPAPPTLMLAARTQRACSTANMALLETLSVFAFCRGNRARVPHQATTTAPHKAHGRVGPVQCHSLALTLSGQGPRVRGSRVPSELLGTALSVRVTLT